MSTDNILKPLKEIINYHGKVYDLKYLSELIITSPFEENLDSLSDVLEKLGFRTTISKVTKRGFEKINMERPLVVHNNGQLKVVLKKEHSLSFLEKNKSNKITEKQYDSFLRSLNSEIELLLVEPSPIFFSGKKIQKKNSKFLFSYFRPYKKYFFQLILGAFVISFLQIIAPFLTQLLIDKGVNGRDISLINVIIIAMVVLQVSKITSEFIKNWFYLHVSTRVSISIISDFLIKVLKLPIGFFSNRSVGDIMQRIDDQKRIERFLTHSLIKVLFSFLTFAIYAVILFFYDATIFSIFISLSLACLLWNLFFLNVRKKMDYQIFKRISKGKNIIIQTLQSIQDIKLENLEKGQRWKWERNEVTLFKEKKKLLYVNQADTLGSTFINEMKNLLILFISAKAVVAGDITLGALVAIQYIIGATNRSISDFSTFIVDYQMAQISIKRITSIYDDNNENERVNEVITSFPTNKDIIFENVFFGYSINKRKVFGLDKINFTIPENKITAIIGASGSGKTTLLKLMLKFSQPFKGKIYVGNMNLRNMDTRWWRSKCGVVFQDSKLFNKSILRNIVGETTKIDMERLIYSMKVTNIYKFVDSLPSGLKTVINYEGQGLSPGQRQRVLLARLVYKNPQFVFLDEATSSIDARNEKSILENLKEFFINKTVVIVTHKINRVSTVDNVILIGKGKIFAEGSHKDLMNSNENYKKLYNSFLDSNPMK